MSIKNSLSSRWNEKYKNNQSILSIWLFTGQGIQNIQQQMLGQAMGSIGGQPMVQYQQQTQQVYQQSLGLQQVSKK